MQIVKCAIDLAKLVFHVFGMTEEGKVIKKRLRRKEVLKWFTNQKPLLVGMEACGGSHYWARELQKQGHTTLLISPHYVKPYVKGNKNDYNDAEGIFEAMSRPTMRYVGIKTVEQQDILLLHRIREQKVKARTALANQLRGLLGEYGIVLPKRIEQLRKRLVDELTLENSPLSERTKQQLYALYEDLLVLDDRVHQTEKELKAVYKQSEACQRVAKLPGVGYLTATAIVAHLGDVSIFKNGREVAAYLGLVPRQHSTGGREVLLGISKRGDSYIRTLLIHGARSVLRYAKDKSDKDSRWLMKLTERRGKNKACVAQANKTARRIWAVLAKPEEPVILAKPEEPETVALAA